MLDKIAAFKEFHDAQAPTAPARYRVTDAEAVALVSEAAAAGATFRNPSEVGTAVAALDAALKSTPPTDISDLAAWALKYDAAQRAFWDAFAGEVINGVEIIRKVS
jgi:hypothetical protein